MGTLLKFLIVCSLNRSTIVSNLFYRSDFDFKSKIVNSRLNKKFFKLCQFRNEQEWTLLYRASEHGFKASDFHAKCDNIPKTLTVIKSSNGNIFGGYTDQSWDSDSFYKSDPNAFLFSLTNLYKQPVKIKINPTNSNMAIYCSSENGPSFGSFTDDLAISSRGTNNMKEGASKLSSTFQLANYPQGSDGSNFLAGSTYFHINEIEVFMKN